MPCSCQKKKEECQEETCPAKNFRRQSRSLPDSGMRVRYPLGGGGSAAGRAQGMRQRCAAHHVLVLQAAQ